MPTSPARAPIQELSANVQQSIPRLRSCAALLTLFVAAALFAGCNATSGGLSSQLPSGGANGSLSFAGLNGATKSTLVDAIAGRAYSKVAVTSVVSRATTNYPASPTTASGTAPITCTVIAGAPPTGVAVGAGGVGGSGCLISGTPVLSPPGQGKQFTFTIQAQDSNSPPNITQEQVTLTVRPEFTLTAPTLPPAVQGRTYGTGSQTAPIFGDNLSATAPPATTPTGGQIPTGNGPLSACNLASVTPSNPNLATALAASGCALRSTGANPISASGTFTPTVQAVDNAITDPETNTTAVLAASTVNAPGTLTAASALKLVANADAVSAAPPSGVVNRSYGTAASGCSPGPACLPLKYLASGGLPSVAASVNYAISATTPSGISCLASIVSPTPPTGTSPTTCSGTPTAAGSANVVITADDPGNSATPGSATSGTSGSFTAGTLTVNSVLALATDAASVNPPTDAVQGRTYGNVAGGFKALVYDATNGLGGYKFTVPSSVSTPAANGVPAPVTCTSGAAAVNCTAAATPIPISTAAGSYPFSITVDDTANASTPDAASASQAQTLSPAIKVDPPLVATLTQATAGTNPVNLLDGVTGRTYGIVGAAPTYAGTGGIGAASYEWCVSSGTLPTGFAGISANCATPTTASSVTITANPATGSPAGNAFTVRLDDLGNATTPGSVASATSATNSTNLLVRASLSILLAQNGVNNPPSLLDGVINRSYGTINAGAAAPTYAAAGGISGAGGSNYEWCATFTSTGSAPGGFTGISQNCAAPTPGSPVSLTASTVTGFANSFTVGVKLDDLGNAATPGSVASATSATNSATLLIHPQLSLTAAPAAIPDAVIGRTYGTPNGSTDLVYTVPPFNSISAGLGTITLGPLGLAASTTSGFPVPVACSQTPASTPTLACNSSNGAVTSAAATFHPTATVADTGNAATPAGNAQSQLPMIVDAPLLAKLTQTGNGTPTNPSNLLDGVLGRTYGVIGGTPTYTGTGGLGAASYEWCVSAGTLPGSFVGVSTNCAAPTIAPTTTLTANPANTTAAPYAFTVRLDDGGNATTPGSAVSSTSSSNATNLLLHPALSATLVQNSVNNPAALLDGVVNRSYGLTLPAGTPTYTANGGLPTSYEWCENNAPAGFNTLLPCPAYTPEASAVLTAPALAGPAANISNIRVQVDDTGNSAVPASAASGASGVSVASLLVHPQIAIAVNPTTIPDAVTGRTYGKPNGTEDLVYSAPESNSIEPGLAPVTLTPTGLPAPIACNPTSSTPPTLTCNGANAVVTAIAGSAVTVTGSDVANAATPAATLGSDPGSQLVLPFAVDAPLAITTTTLPNGLLNYPYPTVSTGATLTAAGGLGGNTWFGPGSTTSGGCPASLNGATNFGNIGFTLNSTSTNATITGTPSAASASAGQYAFQVCVIDSANGTTPAGDAQPATANADPTTLTIDVMTPYAVIAEPGANAVDFFDTSKLSDSGGVTMQPVQTGTGTAPYAVAFSPSGQYAYVTFSGNNSLAVFDTIKNAQITSPSSPIALTGCTTPHGVAATATEIFVACNGSNNVLVLDATTLSSTPIATLTLASGTAPEAVVVRADGLRAYVTLSGTNQLFVIDNSNSASPVALATTLAFPNNPATLPTTTNGSIPFGIVLAPNGADTFAYIAKQKSTSDTTDSVEILTITKATDAIGEATDVSMSSAGTAQPTFLALTPDNKRVYVTLPGTDQFAVFDNTQTPPVQLSFTSPTPSSPYTLLTAAAAPTGIAVPVLSPVPSSTSYLVFISENATNGVGIVDNLTPPAEDGSSPKALSNNGSGPAAMASTPAPQ